MEYGYCEDPVVTQNNGIISEYVDENVYSEDFPRAEFIEVDRLIDIDKLCL